MKRGIRDGEAGGRFRRWKRALGIGFALAGCGGCCGGGGGSSDEAPTSFTFMNQTPYYLHALSPGENSLYVPPSTAVSLDIGSSHAQITVIVSPGQEMTGKETVFVSCCQSRCGTVYAAWIADSLSLSGEDCSDTPDGSGSCPFVYAGTAGGLTLVGEALVGALNQGARRTDAVVLTGIEGPDGIYHVRVATERPETNHLDAVALEIVEHPAGTRVVKDRKGTLVIGDAQPPLAAATAAGEDMLSFLSTDDGAIWEGTNRDLLFQDKIRDWIDLEFRRPVGEGSAVLLVHGRNTRLLQDSYHEYLAQFGPGLPKLMRLTTEWYPYRPMLEHLLNQAGFAIGAFVAEGDGWIARGTVGPVGSAGMQTVGLTIPIAPGPSPTVKIRLAVLPGSWLIDSVRLGTASSARGERLALSPRAVVMASAAGAGSIVGMPADAALLLQIDQRYQQLEQGEHLDLEFEAPPARPGFSRTAVLRLTGYYDEQDRSRKPCLDVEKLFAACTMENSFARFFLTQLAWQDVVDRYSDEAGVPRDSR
jgi:hypothetical protein